MSPATILALIEALASVAPALTNLVTEAGSVFSQSDAAKIKAATEALAAQYTALHTQVEAELTGA